MTVGTVLQMDLIETGNTNGEKLELKKLELKTTWNLKIHRKSEKILEKKFK